MSVNIVENFRLGTNKPLDSRYVVNSVNDVSAYWFDGMLLYEKPNNKLFVVKDTSVNTIVELIDSSNNNFTDLTQGFIDLSKIHTDTNNPTGFVNYNLDSSIYTIDDVFYLTALDSSIRLYYSGTEFYVTDSSIQIPDVEGFHYVYIDSSQNLNIGQSEEDFDNNIPTSLIYWDSTNKQEIWLSDQRYGISMAKDTRNYLQHSFGLNYLSGLLLYDFSINEIGGGLFDEEAQFSLTDGEYNNEDLSIFINNSSDFSLQPLKCQTYHFEGAGVFRISPLRDFPLINADTSSGRLAYNKLDPSFGYMQVEVNNNWYVNSHLLVVSDPNRIIVSLQGQNQYENLIDARKGAISELQGILGGGLNVSSEWDAFASVTYQTSDSFSNTPKAKIVYNDLGKTFIDFRNTNIRKVSIDEHGTLTGLENDTHKQYALLNGRLGDILKTDTIDSFDIGNKIGFSNNRLSNISEPTDASDATSKKYVDDLIEIQETSILWLKTYVDGSLITIDASLDFIFNNTYDKTYIDGSLNVKTDFNYVDSSLNQKVNTSYFDSSVLQIYNDLQVRAGKNILLNDGSINVIDNPSFSDLVTIETDISIGGNLLFDYENILTVAKSGAKYTSVNDAILDASDGDLIVIKPGTYVEDISINKTLTITGECSRLTIINGKIIADFDGVTTIKNIQLNNTNDHALIFDGSTDDTVLRLIDDRIITTWDSGVGQTSETSKSSVKLTHGQLIISRGLFNVTSSNDNTIDHNTSIFWVTGNNRSAISSTLLNQRIVNILDPNQNLISVFNNTQNEDTTLTFDGGDLYIEGAVSGNNNLYPFFNKDSSMDRLIVQNMVIRVQDSGNLCVIKQERSSSNSQLIGNIILPTNITTTNLACNDSSSGPVSVYQGFYGVVGEPTTTGTGSITYGINTNNGEFYQSGKIILSENVSFKNYTNNDPSLGDFWMENNELFFYDGTQTGGIRSKGQNIGDGIGIFNEKIDASFMFKSIDGLNGIITLTDGSTLYIDSSIYVPGSYTYTGTSYTGNLNFHVPFLYFNTKLTGNRVSNITTFMSATGVTQVSPYDVSAQFLGNYYPWGTTSWDASGTSSVITFTDWIIFYQEAGENIRSSWTFDASNLSNGPWAIYAEYNNGNPILTSEQSIDRAAYPDKCYIGHLEVIDGSIDVWHESPDCFGTTAFSRERASYGLLDKITGLNLYVADPCTLGVTSGHYLLEGASFRDIDFYNNIFTGQSQHQESSNAIGSVFFKEIEPSLGFVDTSISAYNNFLTYKNRYYDVNSNSYIDSSLSGKFILSAFYLRTNGNVIISRGNIYDSIVDAEADILNFKSTSPSLNSIILIHPLLGYGITQTDASSLEDSNQFKLIITTESGGGSGGGGGTVSDATNVGTGVGLYKQLSAGILEFKSLTTTGSDIVISSTSNTVRIDASLKDYDISINALYGINSEQDSSITNLFENKVNLGGDNMTGDLSVPNIRITNDVSIQNSLYIQNIEPSLNKETYLASFDNNGKLTKSIYQTSQLSNEIYDITTNFDVSILTGIYYVDTTAGNISIRIPDSSISNDGRNFRIIKKTGNNNVIITTISGTQNIGSSLSQTISQIDKGISLVSDEGNSKWLIVQDSRFTEGLFTGSLQYWNDTDKSWESTSNNLTWDNSIFSIQNVLRVDSSLEFIKIDASVSISGDVSINGDLDLPIGKTYNINGVPLYSNLYIDGSINSKVNLAGDIMTGNLTAPSIIINNDLSIGKFIFLSVYDNSTAKNGDLWVDPSTQHLFFKHIILSGDSSTYDLVDKLSRKANDWSNFSDSSTLDAGDRILIEDSQDGFAKKWISAEAFTQSVTGGFGDWSAYNDNITTLTTTADTYQTALTLTTDASAPESTYRVAWTLQATHSNNGKQTQYRVIIDSSIVIEEATVVPPVGGIYASFGGFDHVDLSSGTHTIQVQYRRVESPGSSSVKDLRLEFWQTRSSE